MANQTGIEWCDSTFNPWIGCTRVSPACDDCYAARSTPARTLGVAWGPGQPRHRTAASTWAQVKRWNAEPFVQCASCGWRGELRAFKSTEGWTMCPACSGADWHGARRRVFCASLADVFDNEVDPAWRAELFVLIAATPHLDWLLLTKRIGNVAKMIEAPGMQKCGLPPNAWLGATVVSQAEADRDMPKLLAVPARVRFLSIEPMLGPIELGLQCENWSDDIVMDPETGARECCKACDYTGIGNAIDWVICGGESGPGARPMHPDWTRSLRDQCAAAGVPFLFKQWGEWLGPLQDGAPDLDEQEINASNEPQRVGKKAAGRLLDGRTHDGFPS